jgi:release factor glutamine methyltransferase
LTRDTAVALTAAGIDNARFEARLLVSKASGRTIETLIAHGNDVAPADVIARLRKIAARRVQREPMAYILGEREFWGIPFRVTPDVLVPRPDSETLIEAALAMMPDRNRPWRFLDLGVGSGCLLLTLLKEFPAARGVGMDASAAALAVAAANAATMGQVDRITFVLGDWSEPGWETRLGAPFDLVLSNPPYIATGAIAGLMTEVARFEPKQALDGGPDGLAAYRQIARAGRKLITKGGRLLVEAGEGQAPEIAAIFEEHGITPEAPWKDLSGIDRVVPGKH